MKDVNTEYYDYFSDCANFISQCLFDGGFEMNEEWHCYKSERSRLDIRKIGSVIKGNCNQDYDWDIFEKWRLAKEQYNYFKNSSLISGEVVVNSENDITNAVKNGVQVGDIMYFEFDQTKPHHATIITKIDDNMIYYSAHTNNANDKALSEFFKSSPKGIAYILKVK